MWRGKCELDNVLSETHAIPIMDKLLETVANLRDEKDDRPLPHQIRRNYISETACKYGEQMLFPTR